MIKSRNSDASVSDESIAGQIFIIRGQKVMIDRDLAKLYGVQTKALKQAVKRNLARFPADFMFELNANEAESSRSQNVTLKRGENIKYLPMAFTEQGVAMLSSVLNSEQAIKVNIQIIRIFTRLRQAIMDNTDLRLEIEQIKKKLHNHSQNIEIVFRYLDELIEKKKLLSQENK
jgi:phage regulator Rha-like protein